MTEFSLRLNGPVILSGEFSSRDRPIKGERLMLEPMFLCGVEEHDDPGPRGAIIREIKAAEMPVPQIMHLFAYKPERTEHLARFTQEVMRGRSPLSPGQRELIAAFTSYRNSCPF